MWTYKFAIHLGNFLFKNDTNEKEFSVSPELPTWMDLSSKVL